MKKPCHKPVFEVLEARVVAAAVASLSNGVLTIDSASDPAGNPTILRNIPGGVRWSDGAGHGGNVAGVTKVVVNGAGRDFVDAHGFKTALVVHGAMNADAPAPSGYQLGGFAQQGTPNCGIAAAVDAEIADGRFHGTFAYAGVFTYYVHVGNLAGTVHFDGRFQAGDPGQSGTAFWAQLLNRRYIAQMGSNPIAGTDALRLVEGLSPYDFGAAQSYAVKYPAFSDEARAALLAALASHRPALLGTHFSGDASTTFGGGPTDPRIVPDHYYAAVGYAYVNGVLFVTAFNPWGFDGGTLPSGNPNDGLVTLPWTAWAYSIQTVEVRTH